jgi:hypothetical protein
MIERIFSNRLHSGLAAAILATSVSLRLCHLSETLP